MSFMPEHFSKSLIEQFRDRSLDVSTLSAIAAHLESCVECYELFREAFRDKKGGATARFTLSSAVWLKDEHIEYEQIVSYVDGSLDAEDREILDKHIELCMRCRDDVRNFVAHRQQIEPELKIRYVPYEKQPKWRHFADWLEGFRLPLKPAHAVYTLLLISALVAVIIFLRRDRSISHSGAPIANVTPTPTPNTPTMPNPIPGGSAIASQSSSGADKSRGGPVDRRQARRISSPGTEAANWRDPERLLVSLRDGGKQISLDDTGALMGLGDLPASTRRLVKETLSSGEIQRPAALDNLSVEKGGVTRSNFTVQPSLKLISPGQVVIIENKPVFKWEPLKGALGYKVYIASRANWDGLSSPTLTPTTLEWTPPTPLRRGETYTWVVSAITEEGELTVPASSEPERKFKVLSERGFSDLIRLKQQTSSRLALGLFYARSGLVYEAEKEFQLLAAENADSTLAAKLLKQARSWR